MTYRSITLTLASLALAASAGLAQAATYTTSSSSALTFAYLAAPVDGFTGISQSLGLDSVAAANGLSIDRDYQWSGGTPQITGGALTDKVGQNRGTAFSFSSGIVAFFGRFNMNPLGEDTDGANTHTHVNDLRFDFYSGSTLLSPSFVLAGPTSNTGLEFDFGLRIDSGSFDRFVIYSAGGGGFPQETYKLSNLQFAAAVPEPETYAMLLAGLGAVGFMARRRRMA